MEVPFTWKPTGWFQIGWSTDYPGDEAVPLRYFGEDLVAYRTEDGTLRVLEAHCKHMGAHLGHGGKVEGDCIRCPFHGWQWGHDGANTAIPDQPRPNRSRRLRVWPVMEQHGLAFLWHDPDGKPPAWEMPDIFGCYPEFTAPPEDYYPPITKRNPNEPVHPQIVLENSADSAHFEFVHHATVTPRLLHWSYDEHIWDFVAGYPDTRSDDPDAMRMKLFSKLFGLGGAISIFDGRRNHRMTFTTTPVENGASDMFYTIWWPREPGDTGDTLPPGAREAVDQQFLTTVDDDLRIWRNQKWVEKPAYSPVDAEGYIAFREWAQRFYDLPPES